MKVSTIRSPQIASFLLRKGCKIVRIKPDPSDHRFTYFVFEDDGNIIKYVEEYTATRGGDPHE